MCGTLRSKAKFTLEASSTTLFGPGVTAMKKPNATKARSNSNVTARSSSLVPQKTRSHSIDAAV
jgi:hypothetical protein